MIKNRYKTVTVLIILFIPGEADKVSHVDFNKTEFCRMINQEYLLI